MPRKGLAQRARLFTTNSELPSSLIHDIHQDSKGIIWIGTEDGLCRYDGAKITTYKNSNSTLHDNYVKLIFEDKQGRLFIGFFNGLQLYDHDTDKFQQIPLLLENSIQFDAHVMSVYERSNGDILIGTSGVGLFKLKQDSSILVANQLQNLIRGNLILEIFEDSNENLWITTNDEGIYRISNNGKSTNYRGNQEATLWDVSNVVEGQDAKVYFGGTKFGLYRYNNQTDSIEHITPKQATLFTNSMQSHPNEPQLILGTDGQGLKTYDLKNNQLRSLQLNVSNLDLSSAKVHEILIDKTGNTWLGLYQKGVALIPFMNNNFGYIGYQSVDNNLIGDKYIMSLWIDQKGTLWVGADGDGIYSLDQTPESRTYNHSLNHTSSPKTVLAICEDSFDNLWLGSYAEGLAKYNPTTRKFERFNKLFNRQSNPAEFINSLAEDKNQMLWVGTLGMGIFSIDLETMKVKQFDTSTPNDWANDNTAVHNNWTSALFVSSDNQLYIGTYDGISLLDLNTGSFINLNETYVELRGSIVYDLYEDSQANIWIGTSKGLMTLNKSTNALAVYTQNDGLPNNVICGIQGYEKDIWVSTNYGISKYDTNDSTFVNFYYNDGLQGNEFGKGTVFKDEQGRIYFGGINGISYFEPTEIQSSVNTPKIMVSGFYLDNQLVTTETISGGYQVTQTSILFTDSLHLSHDDNSFTLEFSSMEFANPKRISYSYTMNGSPWTSLPQGSNSVTFSNLNTGKYHLKVRAKDFNALSEEKPLYIEIHPAWYFSRWAKAIYTFAIVLLLWMLSYLVRQRIEGRRKLEQHQQAKKLNDAKLEFFINISHELKTPISLIINPLKKLIKQDADDSRQRSYFIMHRSADRILKLINQLLDIRKIDKGLLKMKFRETDLIQFMQELSLIFDEQIHEKQIQFSINAAKVTHVYLDPNQFDKVIQNILANAIKFTPPKGEINVDINEYPHDNPQFVSIEIKDSGIGISEDEYEKIFDRFYQSATEKVNSPEGTGIGLHLSRSIVDMHHGTIQARSLSDQQGTSFLINLPLGKAHLEDSEIDQSDSHIVVKTDAQPFDKISQITEIPEMLKPKGKYTVLLADDDDEIRNYLTEELSESYQVIVSMDGEDAYRQILKQSPDLIISDVVMPKIDGITLCKKVKQNININHIPLILLTGKSAEEDNLQGLDIGADAYIAKPFNIDLLQKTIINLIKNRQLLRNNYSGSQDQSDKVVGVELQSTDDLLMQKIMNVINQNIDNPELNVEMIASEIGFSRVHLHRKLKEITNQSTRDLIKNIRLKQAGELLSNKETGISEVAYAVGFSSPAKFSTAFKEFYGLTPTRYVEQRKNPSSVQ